MIKFAKIKLKWGCIMGKRNANSLSPTAYKVFGYIYRILSILLVILSLLLLIVVPVLGVIGIIGGVAFFLLSKKFIKKAKDLADSILAERKEAERKEAERKERERLEKERKENDRLEKERLEKEKKEDEQRKKEQRELERKRLAEEYIAKVQACKERVANDPDEFNRLNNLCATIHSEYKALLKEYNSLDFEDDQDRMQYILKECYRKLSVISTNIEYYDCYDKIDLDAEIEKVERKAKTFVNKYIAYEKEQGTPKDEIDLSDLYEDLDFITDYLFEKENKLMGW